MVSLAAVVAVVGAAVLAMAAGARRTSTAPDRYTRAHGAGFDVTGMQDSGRPHTAELASLAGVRRASSMSFVFGGLTRQGGGEFLDSDEFLDSLVFAGSYEASGTRLVSGRSPDPGQPDEFVVTHTFAEAHGLVLGDQVTLHTLTQADADIYGFDPSHVNGPQVDAVLVGTLDAPALPDASSDPITVFSPALLDDEVIGMSGTVFGLELDDGVSLADLRAQLGTLPEPEVFTVEDAALVSAEARTAVGGQSVGLWVLAGIAAAVTIAAIGQLLARAVRLDSDEVSALLALGYSRRQLLTESALRASIVVVVGLVLAVAVAISASGLFPFGFTRPLEPDPGVQAETVVLLLGALVLTIGLIGWVALMTRPQLAAWSARRGPSTVTAVAARCPTPTMATGVRFAFNAGGTPHPTAAAVAGTAVFIAALVGTLTFAESVRRLVDEPSRYGANFDAMVDNGGSALPPGLVELLESQPDVAAFTLYTASQARVNDVTIAVAGMSPVSGDLTPPVLSGRLPRSADEAALGRRSARELGASIGEDITLTSTNGTGVYRVTGLVVPAGLRGNDIVGRGAVITSDGFGRIFPGAVPNAVAIDFDGTAPPEQIAAHLAEQAGVFYDGVGASRPPAIRSLGRITFVPFALAVLIAVLVALLVVNIVYTGVRRRDTPVAVLRALGADRPWILRATLWQAIAATIVPAAIGVPLGLVAGRHAFRLLADHIGTVTSAAIPLPSTGGAVVTFIALAMIAATVAGRPVRRSQPAPLLRAG